MLQAGSRISAKIELSPSEFGNGYAGFQSGATNIAGQFGGLIPCTSKQRNSGYPMPISISWAEYQHPNIVIKFPESWKH